MEQRQSFNKQCWNNYTSTHEKVSLDTDPTLFTKISAKYIMDLNIKGKIIKLLDNNTGESLDDLGYDDDFF